MKKEKLNKKIEKIINIIRKLFLQEKVIDTNQDIKNRVIEAKNKIVWRYNKYNGGISVGNLEEIVSILKYEHNLAIALFIKFNITLKSIDECVEILSSGKFTMKT